MNEEIANDLIEDIKYTLDINKEEIIKLLLKNHTRKLTISFNVEPDSLVAMNIYTEKAVMAKKDLLEKVVESEK